MPQCRYQNPPSAKFCSNCGATLEVLCRSCGRGNAPGSRFCNECGEALRPAPAPAVAPDAYTPQHLAARILTSRGALEGERKQVTVLLADLKGSMELLADRARGLGRLQSAEFVYETRLFPEVEYTFKHALTHEVAYAGLLHERQRSLHARVVDAIERLYPTRLAEHRDRLVHHAFRGEVWGKALAYLRNTGEVASPAEIEELMGGGPESPGQLWWMGEHDRAIRAAERDLAVTPPSGTLAPASWRAPKSRRGASPPFRTSPQESCAG